MCISYMATIPQSSSGQKSAILLSDSKARSEGPGRGSEFVVTLDADDAFLPTRLERLGELAETRPDLDILATDA